MTQSAKRIVDDSPSQKSQKPFSHLHIVFRTFTYSGTPESVKDFLMKEEDGEKAQIRNQIRKLLVESFESIDVSYARIYLFGACYYFNWLFVNKFIGLAFSWWDKTRV